MDTEIIDVRVVETVPNYVNAIKLAAVGAIATVLVTAATEHIVTTMVAQMKRQRIKNKNTGKNVTDINS